MSPRICITVIALVCMSLLTACAGRSDYRAFYLADQGDYDGALEAARAAQNSGIDDLPFGWGLGAGECRDYSAVITVLVAKSDFAGAQNACRDYKAQCAVVPEATQCFFYSAEELSGAGSDAALAESLINEARENLHFRWLMIRDDYQGSPIRRPIY